MTPEDRRRFDKADAIEAIEAAKSRVLWLEMATPEARADFPDFGKVPGEAIRRRDSLLEEAKAKRPPARQYLYAERKLNRLTADWKNLEREREDATNWFKEVDDRFAKLEVKLAAAKGELAAAQSRAAQGLGPQPSPQALVALQGLHPQLHFLPSAIASGNLDLALQAIFTQLGAAISAMGGGGPPKPRCLERRPPPCRRLPPPPARMEGPRHPRC